MTTAPALAAEDRTSAPPGPDHAALKAKVRELLAAALAALGPTEAKVGRTLEKLNCRGYCNRAEECAVAVYLDRQLTEAEHQDLIASVADDKVIVLNKGTGRTVACVDTPPPVHDFVKNFDKRKYPQLTLVPMPVDMTPADGD